MSMKIVTSHWSFLLPSCTGQFFIAYLTDGLSCETPIHSYACQSTELIIHTRIHKTQMSCASCHENSKLQARWTIDTVGVTFVQSSTRSFFIQHWGISRGRPLSTAGLGMWTSNCSEDCWRKEGTKWPPQGVEGGQKWKLNISNLHWQHAMPCQVHESATQF